MVWIYTNGHKYIIYLLKIVYFMYILDDIFVF